LIKSPPAKDINRSRGVSMFDLYSNLSAPKAGGAANASAATTPTEAKPATSGKTANLRNCASIPPLPHSLF
jgi:hypothetical protein